MEKLLNCPHCGGAAEFISCSKINGYISCVGECKIQTGKYWDNLLDHEIEKTWKQKALEDWNRRYNSSL